MIGVFTHGTDFTQLLTVGFVLFFLGLVYYLRGEDKREGYPLEEAIPTLNHRIVGFPGLRRPKTYERLEGGFVTLPQEYERHELNAQVRETFPGSPLYPVREPLIAGVGPGAYTLRRDEPFVMLDGSPQLEPLRSATDYLCVDPALDPRGRSVVGADLAPAGRVVDIWIDKGSKILRYIEIALHGEPHHRLVPIFSTHVPYDASYISIEAISSAQLALAPVLRDARHDFRARRGFRERLLCGWKDVRLAEAGCPAMNAIDTRLMHEDAIVWQGTPSWRAIARDLFHLRGMAAYLGALVALDAYQAYAKAIPVAKALHDSVPLMVIIVGVLSNFLLLAWLTARTTRYTITTRRVTLSYGIAISASLTIPHSRIARVELAQDRNGFGDIALTLSADDHMPYLKLWPHARPWHLVHPQPMLRGVPQACLVAGLAIRAIAASEGSRPSRATSSLAA